MSQETKRDQEREEVFGEVPQSPMERSDLSLPRRGRRDPMANRMMGGAKSQLAVFLLFILIVLLIIFIVL